MEDLTDPIGIDVRSRKSVVVLEWLGAVLAVAVGAVLGLIAGAPLLGAAVAVLAVGVVGLISRYWGESILLSITSGQGVTGGREVSATAVQRLDNLLEGLCLGAGLEPPSIRVVDSASCNLAVVSTRADHGTIVVTSSMLDSLDLIELEGVVGVVLARIRSGEARRSARLALRLGLPMVLAGLVWRRSRRFGEMLVALVSPLWRLLVARVAPRSIYFEADVAGCLMTRYPPGLIAAYTKIAAGEIQGVPPLAVPGAAHLWLLNPYGVDAGGLRRYEGFSHQPPLDERITLLKDL